MRGNQYRPDIDGLRAIAVLAVVLYHFVIPPFAGGFVGVDVFFVISGYLITKTISEDIDAGRFALRNFYLARVRRIIPALLAVITLTFLAGALVMAPVALQELSESALAAVLSVSNFYFWASSGYFDTASSSKPLLHTWSLGIEEQFYFVWPALLMITSGRLHRWRTHSIALIALASLVASQFWIRIDQSGAFYLLPFRAFELAAGGLLVFCWPGYAVINSRPIACLGLLAGVGSIVAAAILFTTETPFPGIAACLPVVGAAMAIAFGQAPRASIVLTNRPAVWVGKISYSLYLVHWPLLVFTKYVLMRDLTPVEVLACLFATFVFAHLLYTYVEQPFRRKSHGVFSVPSRGLLIFASLATVAVAVPAWSASRAGWDWRLDDGRKALRGFANSKKYHFTFYGGISCSIPRCEAPERNGRRVYVLGDSHARALYAGLIKAFPEIDLVVYGPSSCPFFSRAFTIRNTYSERCDTAKAMAFKEIAEHPGPIILTQYWASRLADPYYSVERPRMTPLEPRTPKEFSAFLSAQLQDLQKLIGKQAIILIGGVPRFGFEYSPLDCMSRPLRRGGCATSERKGFRVAQQEIINRAMRASIGDKVSFIDPYDFLCDEASCRNLDEDKHPIYSDETHLSLWGSDYLVTRMTETLRPAIEQGHDVAAAR